MCKPLCACRATAGWAHAQIGQVIQAPCQVGAQSGGAVNKQDRIRQHDNALAAGAVGEALHRAGQMQALRNVQMQDARKKSTCVVDSHHAHTQCVQGARPS